MRVCVPVCVCLCVRVAERSDDLVAACEELRVSLQELGAITGRVSVEQLLDVIFRDFCIGK